MACVLAVGGHARAQGTGSIVGRVFDSSNGRPVSGAGISVAGARAGAQSDVDGRFTITDVPAGTYEVRISAPLYGSTRIRNVHVVAGEDASVRASLEPQGDSDIEVVEVVADVTESSAATQLLKRKMAPTVSDNLGAESISRTPDSDAAEVVTRVPAVTIKDDAFIVVRGLGDRYNSALVNRSLLPSTDPTRRIVPLDLFPAGFIESLTLVKSYTPDLPGDFAGGLVNISLTDPPSEPRASLQLSLGGNTVTTFADFDSYDGAGFADWFGFGVEHRELPSGFPETKRDVVTLTALQERKAVGSLNQNWNTRRTDAPPGFGASVELGNTWGPFGMSAALTYGAKPSRRNDEIVRTRQDEGIVADFVYDRSTLSTGLGGLLTATYKLANGHRLSTRVIGNRKSEDETLIGLGTDALLGNREDLQPTSTIYTADQLLGLQIEGQHSLGFVDVDWRGALSQSQRWQPDAKFTIYRRDLDADNPVFILATGGGSAGGSTTRYFSELDELLQDYGVDLSVPFDARFSSFGREWGGNAQLSAGLAYTTRERDFKLRLFDTLIRGTSTILDFRRQPDDILRPENYGFVFDLQDNTNRPELRFKAAQDIAGIYLMVDLPIVPDRLRLIGGIRTEYSYIRVEGVNQTELLDFTNVINDVDFLPALSIVYSPTERSNIRLALSQTVSRPQFRELNPAQFPTAPGQRAFRGNENLESSTIQNLDLRWEWFPSQLELVSAGFFAKNLEEPIEINVAPRSTVIVETRSNAGSATLFGIELEARKNFEFARRYLRRFESLRRISAPLSDIEFVGNVTLVESEAKGFKPLRDDGALNVASRRALTDQAPFVINASLQYDHFHWGTFRLLYNTVGDTIVAAANSGGGQTSDDVIAERRDQLDFVWLREWSLMGRRLKSKISVENITNDDFFETQGVIDGELVVTNRYFTGVSFGASLTFEF